MVDIYHNIVVDTLTSVYSYAEKDRCEGCSHSCLMSKWSYLPHTQVFEVSFASLLSLLRLSGYLAGETGLRRLGPRPGRSLRAYL